MSTLSPLPCDIIIFGAYGDLALRKLLPALYQLDKANLISSASRIIGVARRDSTDDEFAALVFEHMGKHISANDIDTATLQRFQSRIKFIKADINEASGFKQLASTLNTAPDHHRIFYFATAATLFGTICKQLKQNDCCNQHSRVVLEKPLGHDFESSQQINAQVAQFFDEASTYRIDHYLGKETVQNLIALRFANPLFSSQWSHESISHVEITVAESVGIEGRWGYFDKAGQARDMLQNHLLQLLCLIAMDSPNDLSAEAIRQEKVRVLKALQPINKSNVHSKVVRGQYAAGEMKNSHVPGYLEEDGANTRSQTETFIAIKAEINNWRWASVPFYLRTGKRMPEKLSQIVIHFKPQVHNIFADTQSDTTNQLIIRLQPNEGVHLDILTKDPGLDKDMSLQSTPINLNFAEAHKVDRIADAYERLLLDVMQGKQNLFVHRDEIESAWLWCDSLIQSCQTVAEKPKPYTAGSWGPEDSITMMTQDGRSWYENS